MRDRHVRFQELRDCRQEARQRGIVIMEASGNEPGDRKICVLPSNVKQNSIPYRGQKISPKIR